MNGGFIMEKIKIKIEKTPRKKYSAMREVAEPGRSLLILNKSGKRKTSSSKQLVRLDIDDIIICTLYYNNNIDIKIYRVLSLEDSEYAYIKELNSFRGGVWDDILPAWLEDAVKVAIAMAGVKHD